MKVLLVDLGTPRDEISEPLGIETLAPYITDNVPEAQIYLKSLELDNYSDIGPILKNSHYEIIGLSTKIRAYEKFKTSVEKTQEESPDTILVAGDILGTYAFEDVLKLYNNIICVRGEGETAFSELVKEVAQNKKRENLKLTNIPNLAYISNNELVLTERESFDIRNAKHPLRSLAYKVFDQNGCSRIEGSRGCAYSLCSYCGTVEKYNGPGWKPFDITFVLE
ncbi:MAG: hypothetical protein KJ613_00635, partial [Nanoarchaeota archaeon]|nr:hypothetical protein [Nanoarchaeota archaeon]